MCVESRCTRVGCLCYSIISVCTCPIPTCELAIPPAGWVAARSRSIAWPAQSIAFTRLRGAAGFTCDSRRARRVARASERVVPRYASSKRSSPSTAARARRTVSTSRSPDRRSGSAPWRSTSVVLLSRSGERTAPCQDPRPGCSAFAPRRAGAGKCPDVDSPYYVFVAERRNDGLSSTIPFVRATLPTTKSDVATPLIS